MNPFLNLADAQISAPRKSVLKGSETRRQQRSAAQEKQQAEEDALAKQYRAYCRARREALIEGPHGEGVKALLRFMRTMDLTAAPALVDMVREAAWILALSTDDKHVLLREIARGIRKCRERNGMSSFDDSLHPLIPEQKPRAYEQVRALVGVR